MPASTSPDIPGVQGDSPCFPLPRAVEVERPAVVQRPTACAHLAAGDLVPQWAELPLEPIEHLAVVGDV